jgi:uncharacterized protein YprB with RNaseH-like and TPR domain
MSSENLRHKLGALHNHVAGPSPKKAPTTERCPPRYHALADALGGELIPHHAGAYVLRRTVYPFGHRHGMVSLDSLMSDGTLPLSAFTTEDCSERIDLSQLVFFDTETTGLGGVGAVPFLCGCGSWTSRGFEVRQYTMPDYSDEAAMLEVLADEFGHDKWIVSYNGRAFDLPILRDRMIVNRVAREVPQAGHVDLLHGTRRLFRRRLADCTLTNIERELFGFHRNGDIPGYLIPSVYFEWLSEENLDLMPDIIEHNCLDIVSLAFLADHIAQVFATAGESLSEADDLHSLARVYGRRRQNDRVTDIFERLAHGNSDLDDDVILFHASAFKRSGRWEQAVALWCRLEGTDSREAYWANLELAKYYEHQTRDLQRAVDCAKRAREICPYGTTHQTQLKRRLSRLNLKMDKVS